MTEHEIRQLAFWIGLILGEAYHIQVFEDAERRWLLTINGIGPIYYLWEWPMYREAMKTGRW